MPIFFINNSLDEPHKLAEYGLDENSVRRNYQNKLNETYKKKPQIVCAIGTLKMNEKLEETRTIDEAFPINVHACQSVYQYSRKNDEEYEMTMEMNIASGCSMARNTENGRQYCQIVGLICPSQQRISYENITVECCCEGSHLCNHDMNSYHAFYALPEIMNNPLCAENSVFRFIFMPGKNQYCAVHYDFVLGKVVNLHMSVNMDLPREEDYDAYQQLGCRFIEAKIRVHIPIRCENEVYKRDDTLIGRLIYMCTCPRKTFSE
ncbi:unnamed protein product, partial [Onchocerca ochengi]|uniref:VWFD domain-containing protein n=1 Tax=Onchocerca ochengi TaxID=42157 RepID=A0A182EP05_ONCOC